MPKAWELFGHHHYLSTSIAPTAQYFVGLIDGRPAAFCAAMGFPHPVRPGWREHRLVCLPDFQGVGIGNAMSEYVASLFKANGKAYFSTTSNPAMIHHRARSPVWKMIRKPSMVSSKHRGARVGSGKCQMVGSFGRMTAGFEYIGPARVEDAAKFGLLK